MVMHHYVDYVWSTALSLHQYIVALRHCIISIFLQFTSSLHHFIIAPHQYTTAPLHYSIAFLLHHSITSKWNKKRDVVLLIRTLNRKFKTILHQNLKWRIKHKNGAWTYQMVHQNNNYSSKCHQTHLYLSPNFGFWSPESIDCISFILQLSSLINIIAKLVCCTLSNSNT